MTFSVKVGTAGSYLGHNRISLFNPSYRTILSASAVFNFSPGKTNAPKADRKKRVTNLMSQFAASWAEARRRYTDVVGLDPDDAQFPHPSSVDELLGIIEGQSKNFADLDRTRASCSMYFLRSVNRLALSRVLLAMRFKMSSHHLQFASGLCRISLTQRKGCLRRMTI